MKPARLRPLAEEDLVDAAAYYAKKGGRALGERMFDAALAALKPIQRVPAMGSPRLGQLCEIDGLRSWRVTGFPMQWLYFESEEYLDVVACWATDKTLQLFWVPPIQGERCRGMP